MLILFQGFAMFTPSLFSPENEGSIAHLQPHSTSQVLDPAFLADRVSGYFRNRVEGDWRGGHIMKGRQPGPNDLILSTNDYLSLSDHPQIMEAQVRALRENGRGILRSDVFRQGDDALRRFETGLAALMGAGDAVTCQSGWNANVGLLQSIAGPETPVYIDMQAHTSLWEGILSAGATARPFKHNDPASLDRMAARHGPGVVAVDAVYSTSGEIAPLEGLADAAARHGCVMVVDESHSLGVFGPRGEGLTAQLGLSGQVHFRTASLSKAFAARGGIVAGSARNMEYFRFESRPAIFSSGILPQEAAGFLATLDVIVKEGWRREALAENAEFLRARLAALDYNVEASQCQIVSLVAGPEANTMVLRDALERHGIFGSVFCAPATAKNRSLIRFSVNASLTRGDLERIAAVCGAIRHEVGLYEWRSTKRRNAPAVEPALRQSA